MVPFFEGGPEPEKFSLALQQYQTKALQVAGLDEQSLFPSGKNCQKIKMYQFR
ncbi:MAG: hypothetical protein KC592_01840 [Nitrospira sp.]|nr:hypothetical protein [Nitrospira sp.]HNP29016.1 hypothetical protein [Nitrospirales bacterium]